MQHTELSDTTPQPETSLGCVIMWLFAAAEIAGAVYFFLQYSGSSTSSIYAKNPNAMVANLYLYGAFACIAGAVVCGVVATIAENCHRVRIQTAEILKRLSATP